MNLLLDTHALLWLLEGDPRLSDTAREVYLDRGNALFFNAAGLWEISIKVSIGKLRLSENWYPLIVRELRRNAIAYLPIEQDHFHILSHLPFHHRDPFDRMLIAQAIGEQCAVMSCDRHFGLYDIEVVW